MHLQVFHAVLVPGSRTVSIACVSHDYLCPVTDLRIGQIGHGLGSRAFRSPTQLFPVTTQY